MEPGSGDEKAEVAEGVEPAESDGGPEAGPGGCDGRLPGSYGLQVPLRVPT